MLAEREGAGAGGRPRIDDISSTSTWPRERVRYARPSSCTRVTPGWWAIFVKRRECSVSSATTLPLISTAVFDGLRLQMAARISRPPPTPTIPTRPALPSWYGSAVTWHDPQSGEAGLPSHSVIGVPASPSTTTNAWVLVNCEAPSPPPQ